MDNNKFYKKFSRRAWVEEPVNQVNKIILARTNIPLLLYRKKCYSKCDISITVDETESEYLIIFMVINIFIDINNIPVLLEKYFV